MAKHMRQIFVTVVVILSFLKNANSQGKILGKVNDAAGHPLPSVSVSLLKATDSSLIKMAVTGKKGDYIFEKIGEGRFFIAFTAVGFDKKFGPVFEVNSNSGDQRLNNVQLENISKALNGVTVTAVRPLIETKIDRTIVNVDASPTNAGATAMEVLEKSPGIMVDNDGNISLRGKAGLIVMMDGKPTYLSAADLASILKNMPASAIDQIEIMTNPPAKFDAAGNSGIINIKTKKGKLSGFNGSIMVGGTAGLFNSRGTWYFLPKTQNSFTFNYRKNKINLFGNYNPNLFRGRSDLVINRKFADDNGTVTAYSNVLTRFKFGNNNHTLKLGLDYYADKKNTFGAVVSGFAFFGHPTPVTTTTIEDENHQPQTTLVSLTQNHLNFKNLSANLNYRHQFDTAGRELTVDVDYIGYDNTSRMLLTTNFYNGSGQVSADPLYLENRLPSLIGIYSFKSDYVHPLKKGGQFEAGVKASYVKNDNLVDYQRLYQDEWIPDSRSNHFIYDENVNAAYLNLNKQFKKWTFQAGLRLENTIAKGHQLTNDSTFRRDFTNLFPSLFASYALDKMNSLTLSYSRRITRPNYQDLNPFTYFLDSLSYRQGNPYLLPQFTQNFELGHSYNGKIITTINYTMTRDVIAQILKQNEQSKIVYSTADNVSQFRNMGLSVTAPIKWAKWWNTSFFANVYNNRYKGVYNGDPIDIAFTSFTVNVTNSFTIRQGLTAEWSGWYRAKGIDGLSINDPMYSMSLGGQKQVMKGKGTIRINIRDPFGFQKYGGITRFNAIDVKISNHFDTRQLTASFTYRFGKNLQQSARRRSSATQEEQNRAGGSQQ